MAWGIRLRGVRRVGVLVVAVLVAFGAVTVIPVSSAAAQSDDAESDGAKAEGSDVSVTRYGGADRYETSLQVAEAFAAGVGGSLEWLVLVSGERWTDAVVAASLAGARGAPVLMTPPNELRTDALEFVQRVGVSRVMVVGPDASGGEHGPGRGVDEEVLGVLRRAGIDVARAAGVDRYSTSRAVAALNAPGSMGDLGSTAIVASGEVFADALVAGPFAARGLHPVLLTPPGELHDAVTSYLASVGIEHVVLMGGTAALSDEVEQSIEDLGIAVTRLAGSTRYDTAVRAAELVENRYSDAAGQSCFASGTIGVARARVPFDSFSAAPLLGRLCAPLVLADPGKIPPDTAAYLDAAREANPSVDLRVFGGVAAVSQSAVDAYSAGEGTPELEEAEDTEGEQEGADRDVLAAGTCGGAFDDEPMQLVPSTSAEDPAWSPDCSRLVYTQDSSLWTVSNDGSDAQELVHFGGAYLYSAVWSADGTRIAYVRGRNDENGIWMSHIWTVNVDGSHNNQRTEGDVVDRWPAWSPDGSKIAFERETGSGRDEEGNRLDGDRHIVVMTSYGNKPKALNEGGAWERSPAWSPDGSRLAFWRDGFVTVSDTGGGNERRIHAAVYFDGGLSWSPDGTRIAFVRGDRGRTSVVIADIDGVDEEVVVDEGVLTLAPRWSPDGQRIAFHTIDDEGKHRAYVVGASGEPSGVARYCRPRSVGGTTAGFPLPEWAPSALGTVRIGVLFMDFPDAEAAHTAEEEAARGLPWAEEYLETVSYGKLDVQFVPHYQWLRAPKRYADYYEDSVLDGISRDAVDLVDAEIDFSGFHSLAVVLPSTHFSGGVAGGSIEADGVSMRRHINNSWLRDEPVEFTDWGDVAAHELVHNLGLLDMYAYDAESHALPELDADDVWVTVDLGLMGLNAYFIAGSADGRLQLEWRLANGGRISIPFTYLAPQEMLAWSRWQLGWLTDTQVDCVTGAEETVRLGPIADPRSATAMAAVPLNSHEVIVLESRRQIGYDTAFDYTSDDGTAISFPAPVTPGVVVYTVDSFVESGELPVRFAGDSGNGQVADFPVLEVGDSVTVHGYTITVTADDGDTHTVSITRNS